MSDAPRCEPRQSVDPSQSQAQRRILGTGPSLRTHRPIRCRRCVTSPKWAAASWAVSATKLRYQPDTYSPMSWDDMAARWSPPGPSRPCRMDGMASRLDAQPRCRIVRRVRRRVRMAAQSTKWFTRGATARRFRGVPPRTWWTVRVDCRWTAKCNPQVTGCLPAQTSR